MPKVNVHKLYLIQNYRRTIKNMIQYQQLFQITERRQMKHDKTKKLYGKLPTSIQRVFRTTRKCTYAAIGNADRTAVSQPGG